MKVASEWRIGGLSGDPLYWREDTGAMANNRFRLSIGAKRQVTLPAELLDRLQVPERGELQLEVIGDHAVMTPMVSVPRSHLPEELRRTFESRRGAQPSDIPLAGFLEEIGYKAPAHKPAAAPQRPERRLANLTRNEKQEVSQFLAKTLNQQRQPAPTHLERALLEQGALGETKVVRTRARQSTIHAWMVGHTIAVHNGRKFVPVYVTEDMVGHKLAEFAATRPFKGHSSTAVRQKPGKVAATAKEKIRTARG